jgi:hypothetical protein
MPEQNCPVCRTVLISGKGFMMVCPKPKCPFVDKRAGNSTIDPRMDRRGGGVPAKNNPWKYADRKSIR